LSLAKNIPAGSAVIRQVLQKSIGNLQDITEDRTEHTGIAQSFSFCPARCLSTGWPLLLFRRAAGEVGQSRSRGRWLLFVLSKKATSSMLSRNREPRPLNSGRRISRGGCRRAEVSGGVKRRRTSRAIEGNREQNKGKLCISSDKPGAYVQIFGSRLLIAIQIRGLFA
jgi:hypothetical protein